MNDKPSKCTHDKPTVCRSEFVETGLEKPILMADRVKVGACVHRQDNQSSVGISLLAKDGTVFAHAHFDLNVAADVAEALAAAIESEIYFRKPVKH